MIKYCMILLAGLLTASFLTASPAENANNRFFEYIKSLNQTAANDTVLISPFSIQQVLGVLYLGSDGDTARQINLKLGINSKSAPWLADSAGSLGAENEFTNFNSLLLNRYFNVDQRYLKAVHNYYNSKIYWADFARPEKAAAALNELIAKQTRGLFNDLLSPGDISPSTIMAILNVLYYKSEWLHKFDKAGTTQINFTNAAGKHKLVNMMYQKKFLPYFYDRKSQIHGVILPYKNTRFEMVLMMPYRDYTTMGTLLEKLSDGALEKWLTMASQQHQTEVILPKMDLTSKLKLAKSMQKFGIIDAFSPMLANFTGMGISSAGQLYLQEILHFVKLKVDEDGTEGAAVTIAMIETASVLQQEEQINYFRADRPFVLLLRDKSTQAVLFAGVINDLPAISQD